MDLNVSDFYQTKYNKTITKEQLNKFLINIKKYAPINLPLHTLKNNNLNNYTILSTNNIFEKSLKFTQLNHLNVKNILIKNWESNNVQGEKCLVNDFHKIIFPIINSYLDFWMSSYTKTNEKYINEICLLHILNHIYKNKIKILKNNEKINKSDKSLEEYNIRDQGFTRPKILILAPFKNIAYEFIKKLLKMIPPENKKSIDNESRFEEEYGNKGGMPIYFHKKPSDFQKMFRGNIEDDFKIGISLLSKSVKLFSDFFLSDFIVASPIALKLLCQDKKNNIDFLSSIEILLIIKADVFLMQNFEHLIEVVNLLNQLPKKNNDTNFFRVKNWYLSNYSKHYRQNIILSSFLSSDISSLFSNFTNISGKCKLRKIYTGINAHIIISIKQIFKRFNVDKIRNCFDLRHKFFKDEIMPYVNKENMNSVLIFVSHYFDFKLLCNYFENKNYSFASISEYSTQSEMSKNRHMFEKGKVKFIVITERLYFFRRFKINNVKNIIFFSLPNNSIFYSEILNNVQGENGLSLNIFCKYDAYALERIVGSERKVVMMESLKDIYMFY